MSGYNLEPGERIGDERSCTEAGRRYSSRGKSWPLLMRPHRERAQQAKGASEVALHCGVWS
jgi:hypothetical protein